jgi:hypothetical protein
MPNIELEEGARAFDLNGGREDFFAGCCWFAGVGRAVRVVGGVATTVAARDSRPCDGAQPVPTKRNNARQRTQPGRARDTPKQAQLLMYIDLGPLYMSISSELFPVTRADCAKKRFGCAWPSEP